MNDVALRLKIDELEELNARLIREVDVLKTRVAALESHIIQLEALAKAVPDVVH